MRHTRHLPIGAVALLLSTTALQAEELNALVWCDHADRALLEPFEKAHDVRVNIKEIEGTGEALSILSQSRPGDWDILVVDTVDVRRFAEQGLLAPLPDAELPTADFFPQLVMADVNRHEDMTYAVTEKFGYNTIAYNAGGVNVEDMRDLSSLWTDAYAGKIALYDNYLPLLTLIALEQGILPTELTADRVEELRDRAYALRANARQAGGVVASQTALATGEVDILIGGGEWITGVLSAENPAMQWTVPDEGAIIWSQSIAVIADAANPEMALEFVKYIVSPEGQARLATSECFWGMPANTSTAAQLSDAERAALRWDDQEAFLARSYRYPVVDAELDAAMQDLWTDVLQQ